MRSATILAGDCLFCPDVIIWKGDSGSGPWVLDLGLALALATLSWVWEGLSVHCAPCGKGLTVESVYLWTEIMWAFHRGAACWGLTNSSCRVSPGTPLSFPHTQLNLQDWPSTPLPAPQDFRDFRTPRGPCSWWLLLSTQEVA